LRHPFLLHWFALPLIIPALAACSGGGGSPGAASDASVDAPADGQDASAPNADASDSSPPRLPDATVDGDTPDAENDTDGQGDDADGGAPDSGGKGSGETDAGGETDGGGKDSGETDASAKDSGETDAGGKDGGTSEGGVVPTSCVDLSGQYIENTDDFTLTRQSCGQLTWTAVPGFVNPANWTHVYTTDGVARAVTDEEGNPIVEEAHVDNVAMYVHRTNTSGLDINQTDSISSSPCNLIGAQGVYLLRVTTGTQTACEFWQQQ